MRFVPFKSDGQLDLQALHRVRSRLVGQRTAAINQIRAFLLEHASLCGKGQVLYGKRCLQSWLSEPTPYRCGSLT
jgi:transposase